MSSSAKKTEKILKNKSVLVGVTGGVAAYKSIELVRRLKDEGASVAVIMTDAARQFVTPLSFEVASHNRVYTSLFDAPMAHIELPAAAEVMVIAPATANTISKYAHGIADDLLSTCLLSFNGSVVIAPSMNWRMFENPIFQKNLSSLVSAGVVQVGPERGRLACGEDGVGRMSDVGEIVDAVKRALAGKDLAEERIIVTAGPTREYIDPVRFLSNRSSGKMGFALARAARKRGARVALISGPSSEQAPSDLEFIQVETTEEMLKAVMKQIRNATVLIMAAAVADFIPHQKKDAKIDKNDPMILKLRRNKDILGEISKVRKRPFVIGFSAETGKNVNRAVEKMKRKKMDMVVFNDVSEPGAGFEVDTNSVVIIDKQGKVPSGVMSKDAVADVILDRMLKIKT